MYTTSHLQRQANHFLEIKNVFLHARIPVIKAEATLFIPTSTKDIDPHSHSRHSTNNNSTMVKLSIDISLDGPTHSG